MHQNNNNNNNTNINNKQLKSKRQILDQRLQRIKRNSEILMNKMDAKINSIKQVKQDLNQKSQRMTQWTQRFQEVITSMGEGIFYNKCFLLPPVPGNVRAALKGSVEVVGKIIKEMCTSGKQICILTGAGVSKSCGIPTFRGQDGLYSTKFKIPNKNNNDSMGSNNNNNNNINNINNDAIEYDPDQFLTLKTFQQHPQQIWRWCEQLRQLVSDKQPGKQHKLIHQLFIKLRSLSRNSNRNNRSPTKTTTSTTTTTATSSTSMQTVTTTKSSSESNKKDNNNNNNSISINSCNITLITTNIDNLHTKAMQQFNKKVIQQQQQYKSQPQHLQNQQPQQEVQQQQQQQYMIHEIHGNLQYCLCQNCLLKFRCNRFLPYQQYQRKQGQQQQQQKKQPKQQKQQQNSFQSCPQCKSNTKLRPYILFFDENYSKQFLIDQSLQHKKFEMIIVIGTSLSTGLSARLVQNSRIVVQINPKCVIESGEQVYRFQGEDKNTALVLAQIMKQLS